MESGVKVVEDTREETRRNEGECWASIARLPACTSIPTSQPANQPIHQWTYLSTQPIEKFFSTGGKKTLPCAYIYARLSHKCNLEFHASFDHWDFSSLFFRAGRSTFSFSKNYFFSQGFSSITYMKFIFLWLMIHNSFLQNTCALYMYTTEFWNYQLSAPLITFF